jgi:hypothetical protein
MWGRWRVADDTAPGASRWGRVALMSSPGGAQGNSSTVSKGGARATIGIGVQTRRPASQVLRVSSDSFPGFCGLVTDVRSLEAIVGFRFIARSKARQFSTTEAIGPRPSLLPRRLLKQSPRDRTGFRKRQERRGITWPLHAANAHGQSIHAIFE